jgi:hypothetical protein
VYAQNPSDTLEISANAPYDDIHSPRKAALYSLVLPGLGQAYNKKYWKIPVVYTALGISGYSIGFNAKYFKEFKDAYLIRTDGDSTTIDEYVDFLPLESQLLQYAQFYRKNLDISIIITAAIWTLNIVDALVDAHLYNFDISDDLSLQVLPSYQWRTLANSPVSAGYEATYGLHLKLSF